jgi:hypothetical protein
MATSADGNTWQGLPTPTLFGGGDPGGLTTSDNNLLIVITGEPREGRQRRLQSPSQVRPPGTERKAN